MSELRFPFIQQESLKGGEPQVRIPYIDQAALKGGVPNVRVPFIDQESLKGGEPNVRIPYISQDSLKGGEPNVRVAFIMVEALMEIIPEAPMAEEAFPGFGNSTVTPSVPAALDPFNTKLPGLSIEVKKTPMFKTRIKEAVSGRETRNSLTSMPRWQFELEYEFLEDRTGADSSLKTIQGFFLEMLGSAQAWLFKDPDDYLVTNGQMGIGTGVDVDFYFRRPMGNFLEIVNQVDLANTVNVYFTVTEAHPIPANPGPYTITVNNPSSVVESISVFQGATEFTQVASSPGNDQYSVDLGTGVFTFNGTDQAQVVDITYRYLIAPAGYTHRSTNRIEFTTSPPSGAIVSADFQFFYICRFVEDMMEFDKFADKLWSLQSVEFKSVIS